MMLNPHRNILLLTLLLLHALMSPTLAATNARARNYNVLHPLVYEDSWVKQPFAFINEDGEPDGFNVELVREVMKRLRIPYQVRLRPQKQAHEDLRNDSADLSLGVSAEYNVQWGKFGRVPAALNTNSVMVPKGHHKKSYKVKDMLQLHTYVSRTGRAAYYYKKLGLPDNCYTAVPEMESEILREAAQGTYGAVWNTMNMRWTISRYHLDKDYDMVPLDIPVGHFVFMSKDTVLLNNIDSVLLKMKDSGELAQLEARWLYPTTQQSTMPWGIIIVSTVTLLLIITVIIVGVKRYKETNGHRTIDAIRQQMDFVLNSSTMRVWVYFPSKLRYAWMSNDGVVSEDYNSFGFSKFFPDNVFDRINTSVMHLLSENSDETIVQQMQVYDPKNPGHVLDTDVTISGIADEYRKVYLVVGVHHDVTSTKSELEHKTLMRDCFATAYNMMPLSIMRFNAEGVCTDVNEMTLNFLNYQSNAEVQASKLLLSDNCFLRDIDIDGIKSNLSFTSRLNHADIINAPHLPEGMRERVIHFFNYNKRRTTGERIMRPITESYYDVHFMKTLADNGHLMGYMVTVGNVTTDVAAVRAGKVQSKQLARLTEENRRLCFTRNFAVESTQIFMLRYLPDVRRLIVGDKGQSFHRTLTQLAILFKIAPEDTQRVFRSLRRMDARINTDIILRVHTRIRSRYGQKLILNVAMHPVYHNGKIHSYLGTCADVTHDADVTTQLEHFTELAAVAWNTRQTFLHNMSHAMRLPLITIDEDIHALSQNDEETHTHQHVSSIRESTNRLLRLTDDTLLLSRLESGEPIIKPTRNDFVEIFLDAIDVVKREYPTSHNVNYDVSYFFSTLPVLCDRAALHRIIYEAVALSARYTHSGVISIQFVYHNNEVHLAVEDNSQGLPPNIMAQIFESNTHLGRFMSDRQHVRSGLEMPIVKALCEACGGTIDVSSTSGHGIQTYISLPLQPAT